MVQSLYSAQIPVANYSTQSRQQAIPKALQQVLIKISGNSKVISLPQIQTAIPQAKTILQSYSYSEREDTNNQKTLLLQLNFDPKGIQQILQDANQSLWSKDRPLTLIWLDVRDMQGNNTLINDNNSVAVTLKNNTNRRGIPIILPILDLEDLNKVTPNDIATFNLPLIEAASKRYNTNTILMGYVHIAPNGQWQSKWTLISNGEPIDWNIPGNNIQQILTVITDDVADELASRYATLTQQTTSNQLTITIEDIGDLATYIKAMQYLRNLSIITKMQLLNVTPTSIKLLIISNGEESSLINALNANKKLKWATTTP